MNNNKLDMLDALKEGNTALSVLKRLVATLSQYNQTDMLCGYLNDVAAEYNEELALMGLPTIEEVDINE